MSIFNRLSAIIITLAFSTQTANRVDTHSSLSHLDNALYSSGLNLFNQGCGDLASGEMINKSKCILAVTRLQKVVETTPSLLEAQLRLAEIYYYQPSQMHWGEDAMVSRDKNLKIGYKHLQKAMELDRSHPQVKNLFKKYQYSYKAAQTAGRESKKKDTL